MTKGPEAFRTISEAAAEVGVAQHVLRFWETKFSFIRPMKRAGGRRFYRPQDLVALRGVRRLLYDEGYTIMGVQRLYREHGLSRLIAAGGGAPVLRAGAGGSRQVRAARGARRRPLAGRGAGAVGRAGAAGGGQGQARRRPEGGLTRQSGLPLAIGLPIRALLRRSVAQPGSALAWGARGRGFESRRSDHFA